MLGWLSLVTPLLPEQLRLPMTRLASTSGMASSGNGPPPALFVSETLPEMMLAPISTPAPLEPRATFLRVLAPQPSSPRQSHADGRQETPHGELTEPTLGSD